MNNSKMLHETIVRDIVDVIDSVKNYDQVEWLKNKNKTGSIAKQASNLVLVFPVLVSNSLNIRTASVISKAIERKCVSLLRIIFSSINFTKSTSLQDYVAQFHNNLNANLSFDEFLDAIDRLTESGEIEITDKDAYEAVKEDMKNINYYLSNSFNEVSINDYVSTTNYYGESSIVLEAKDDNKNNNKNNNKSNNKGNNHYNKGYYNNRLNKLNKELHRQSDIINKLNKKNIELDNKYNSRQKMNASDLKSMSDFFKNQLLPQDVIKANELMPTLITVNFSTVDKDAGIVNTTVGIIGIKAKLYPIDSMDIINRISSKYTESNNLFNFVRASTREISFFKDLAFAIDKAKFDAINMSKESKNAKIFKLLERRANKNRFSSLLKKNNASPITSLVMSQEEVEYLKKYNNLDMTKSYITRTILESYNLMDIVIADESLEIARFLYDDGDGIYETLTFDSLEKESSDSSYKKIINLMSKINR